MAFKSCSDYPNGFFVNKRFPSPENREVHKFSSLVVFWGFHCFSEAFPMHTKQILPSCSLLFANFMCRTGGWVYTGRGSTVVTHDRHSGCRWDQVFDSGCSQEHSRESNIPWVKEWRAAWKPAVSNHKLVLKWIGSRIGLRDFEDILVGCD